MLKVLNCFLTSFNLHNPNIMRNFASQSKRKARAIKQQRKTPQNAKTKNENESEFENNLQCRVHQQFGRE